MSAERVRVCCCPCHGVPVEERPGGYAGHPPEVGQVQAQVSLACLPNGKPHDYCLACATMAVATALVLSREPLARVRADREAVESLIRSTRGQDGAR